MEEQLISLIKTLGVEGLHALYLYLILDYGSLLIFLGLCTWGIRVVWKYYKDHYNEY